MACRYFSCSRLVESVWEGTAEAEQTGLVSGVSETVPGELKKLNKLNEFLFTCRGGVGGLKEAYDPLSVEACRAQQDRLRS